MSKYIREGLIILIIKVSSVIIGFLLAVMLARILGVSQYGVYAYVFSIISILNIPAQFGVTNYVVRETAKSIIDNDYIKLCGLWAATKKYVLYNSLFVMVLALLD